MLHHSLAEHISSSKINMYIYIYIYIYIYTYTYIHVYNTGDGQNNINIYKVHYSFYYLCVITKRLTLFTINIYILSLLEYIYIYKSNICITYS